MHIEMLLQYAHSPHTRLATPFARLFYNGPICCVDAHMMDQLSPCVHRLTGWMFTEDSQAVLHTYSQNLLSNSHYRRYRYERLHTQLRRCSDWDLLRSDSRRWSNHIRDLYSQICHRSSPTSYSNERLRNQYRTNTYRHPASSDSRRWSIQIIKPKPC